LILIGFITQYLPWWPITRVLFMYHMFGGLIFMILALAFVLAHLAENLRPPGREWLVAIHLVTAVSFFGYFYPMWSAVPISESAWFLGTGTPPWGPKMWFVHCPPPEDPKNPDAKPHLFCWN
jgi:dolichyl-phosphate-mannose--protein O-mannosyl transferase